MRREEEKINPGHTQARNALRVIGPIFLLTGGIFMAIGMISFFSSMGSFGPPRYFWCCFVAGPLLFIGLVTTSYGFMGAVARYTAGEAAPVGKDTFNYIAKGTQSGIRDVTSAIREGLTGEEDQSRQIRCSSCQHPNDADAQFCDQCGYRLITTQVCVHCENENDPDAKFCDNCGRTLG
ncbi:MAG TPA: hypothetical protein DCM28_01220 [Phycisphaerales bacterium]|nr:hypothetical protein [Phycisphaerales bacterium]HCD31469.1 hypothetical protein [Phycisphaerales bacterium]|tara:strand:- start:538 stop:1074 length:537 start_codon:yes stop_codon:yes gene_type:complete